MSFRRKILFALVVVVFAFIFQAIIATEEKPVEIPAEINIEEIAKTNIIGTFDSCIFGPYTSGCTTEAFDTLMVENKIIEAAQTYGIRVEDALSIAECESAFNSRARNPNSTAKGVYQFTDPTWAWVKAQGHQFDADENIKQFMIWYPIYPSWWKECTQYTR